MADDVLPGKMTINYNSSSTDSVILLSLCMIVRDEENNLPQCLDSVQGVADEIVIVDTGSTDRTVEMAEERGARILHHEWNGDFGAARNVALDAAGGKWILILDADEKVEEEDGPIIRSALDTEYYGAFFLSVLNESLDSVGQQGLRVHGGLRMWLNLPEHRYQGRIHEQVTLGPVQVGFLSARIRHFGYIISPEEAKEKQKRNAAIIRKAIEANPSDPFGYFYLGNEYVSSKDWRRAANQYRLAWERTTDFGAAYVPSLARSLAICLREENQPHEAQTYLDKGLAAHPDFTDLHYLKGIIHLDAGDYQAALRCFERCLVKEDATNFFDYWQGVGGFLSWRGMGAAYEGLGDEDRAISAFQKALEQNRRDGYSLWHLGKLLLKRAAAWEIRPYLEIQADASFPGVRDILDELCGGVQTGAGGLPTD